GAPKIARPVLPALQGGEVQLGEEVDPLRGADEERPTVPVGEHRADDLAPHVRPHVSDLVEYDAVEIPATDAVGIVGAVEADPRAVGQGDGEFLDADRRARNRLREQQEVLPGDVFRLVEEGRYVSVATARALAL